MKARPRKIARETEWRCLDAIEQALTEGGVDTLDGDDKSLLRALFEKRLSEYRAAIEEMVPRRTMKPTWTISNTS